MLSAIALHAAVPYAAIQETQGFLESSDYLTPLVSGAFRMPMFFVLAGFFAALLFTRRTTVGFIKNTVVRIVIPLLVGWAVILPFVEGGLVFSALSIVVNNQGFAWEQAWRLFKEGEYFFNNATYHIWFIYYLLVFYVIFLAVRLIARQVLRNGTGRAEAWARKVLSSHWRVLILALPTIALFEFQPLRTSNGPASWDLDEKFVVLYGAFFVSGAVLFSVRDTLGRFSNGAWWNLVAGIALFGVYQWAMPKEEAGGPNAAEWGFVMNAANGFFVWFLFFGSVGLLMRYVTKAMPAVRYIADSSYWCFMLHLAILAWLPGLIADYGWAPELKFLFVYLLTTAICFATYELFVRWSIIGKVLNGRTYPSGLASLLRNMRRREVRVPAEPAT